MNYKRIDNHNKCKIIVDGTLPNRCKPNICRLDNGYSKACKKCLCRNCIHSDCYPNIKERGK